MVCVTPAFIREFALSIDQPDADAILSPVAHYGHWMSLVTLNIIQGSQPSVQIKP